MTKKRILVVEDNDLNRKLYTEILTNSGYECLSANDGMTAIRLAREEKPDLIIMDIRLPSISGIEAVKWLKEDNNLNHIPIIAVTGFAMKGDQERLLEGGCEDYIAKPIAVGHFLKRIQYHLSPAAA